MRCTYAEERKYRYGDNELCPRSVWKLIRLVRTSGKCGGWKCVQPDDEMNYLGDHFRSIFQRDLDPGLSEYMTWREEFFKHHGRFANDDHEWSERKEYLLRLLVRSSR